MFRRVRHRMPALVLLGSLGGLLSGCGRAPGDEYRTYAETVSAAAPVVEPAALIGAPPVADPLPEFAPAAEADTTIAEPVSVLAEAPVDANALAVVDAVPIDGLGLEPPLKGLALLTSRDIRLLVPEKDFQTVGPEGAVRVSYDDIDLLKVLNMDPVPETAPDYFPDWLRNLDGRRIRIRGFMMPPPVATDLAGFVLARDNQLCCYGRLPTSYDVFPVQLRDNVTVDFIDRRPFDVVGRFNIYVHMFAGQVEYVYYVDDAIVIDN